MSASRQLLCAALSLFATVGATFISISDAGAQYYPPGARPGHGRPAPRPVPVPVTPPGYTRPPATPPGYAPPVTPPPATPPSYGGGRLRRVDCFNPAREGYRGMQMGNRNGTNLFNRAWRRLGQSCDQVDNIAGIIAGTPLAPPSYGSSEFAACFYLGYTDALWASLEATYDRCGDRCFNAGADIGTISAQAYCAVSAVLGGLDDPGFIAQPALQFCGQSVVFGCKTAYVQYAVNPYNSCRQFTEGYFALTFDNTVRQDCWVPFDIPIRDRPYSSIEENNLDVRMI